MEQQRLNRLNNFFTGKKTKKTKTKVKAKSSSEKKSNAPSVFNNPTLMNAFNNLTDEQKEYYKSIGRKMYEDNDVFNTDSIEKTLMESYSYLKQSLNSGLNPKELTLDEINVLEECAGSKWYENFGYTVGDL